MKYPRLAFFLNLIFCFSLAYAQIPFVAAQTSAVSLDNLTKGAKASGFRAEAVYLNEADRAMGARFIHERSGFTLDLLQIQSVPQTFIWANSFPVSDQGEPHTQEHLLITKGNKGRNINALMDMSLTQSNASTSQFQTVYELNTAGGGEAFYDVFTGYMDALLHPDYTDEEVRREVRNWGVAENADKTLRLEEQGSVYNEMTSTMNIPGVQLYKTLGNLIFGDAHPLSFNSGGTPAGIRRMQPADIKRFHTANYHLGNMGAIVSVPKEMTLDSVLHRLDGILNRLGPKPETREFLSVEKIPAANPAPAGKFQIVEYPNKNDRQPGALAFAYPMTLKPNATENVLLNNFLRVFGGSANTNLYKKLIDSKTREIDLGATNVSTARDDFPGNIFIELANVPTENLTEEKALLVRRKIAEEFARIAAFKDGSPELKEFNERFANALVESRRSLSKFVNTPPGFGFRSGGNGYGWLLQTRHLNETKDFRKSVTYKPQIAEAEKMVAGGKNFWRDLLAKWKLTAEAPYAVAVRANSKLVEQDAAERKSRADAEIARLKQKYSVADEQEAVRRYKAERDVNTIELEKLNQASAAKFIENPPLTNDDLLDYRVSQINGVPLVAANFDDMTGATAGIALRADVVPENELVYLSLMPVLLRNTGVVKDGKPLSFEEMSELLRKEILNLNLSFTGNFKTNRYELIARASGNNASESQRAIGWIKTVLQNPNWRAENLPRIRDVVDQQLMSLRRVMQDSEENWVNNPAGAYMAQSNPVHLAALSSLTRMHNAQRLRWMLKDAGNAENQATISAFLTKLAQAEGNRENLKTLLGAMQGSKEQAEKVSSSQKSLLEDLARLPNEARHLATEAVKDLDQTISDVPDSSLAADWAYLCHQMRKDLLQSPETTLANLDGTRRKLLSSPNARMFVIGSRETQAKLEPSYQNLLAGFDKTSIARINYSKNRRIDERVKARDNTAENPIFVGLMAPNMTGGVFINEVPFVSYTDTDREKLLDYLASKLYAGSGGHSVFAITIGAGLAYSNGVSSNPSSGLLKYYAERTPELPQTLGYVIGEIKKPFKESSLSEYVIALSFGSRAALPYEQRGEAMATDLADGTTPEVVSKFRSAILELRKMPNLAEELYRRKDKVYAQILPGYGVNGKPVTSANYFVIGSEKQMSAYENYLKTADGSGAKLYRLYPRDFWLP